MATRPPRSPVIAVDTNLPLDLADRKESAFDALEVIRRRLKPGRILVTPTVFHELVYLADEDRVGPRPGDPGSAWFGRVGFGPGQPRPSRPRHRRADR